MKREPQVDSRQSQTESRRSSSRSRSTDIPEALSRRVVVEQVRPSIDGGRFAIKRTTGELVEVVADILVDGHDQIAARLRHRPVETAIARTRRTADPQLISAGTARPVVDDRGGWRETHMTLGTPGTDEWYGRFAVDEIGWHEYQVVAWVDRFRTWRRDLQIKSAAGQDVSVDLVEGALLIREAAERPAEGGNPEEDRSEWLFDRAALLCGSRPIGERVAAALDEGLAAVMDVHADRSRATTSPAFRVWVDRDRARAGAWYEMFPRSAGPDPNRSGTFAEAAALLPYIADLGFDVVYLPPIHPIGRSFRKGPNNSLSPGPDDPGSPWAIGSEEGGHLAVEPGLGTEDDFVRFRQEAERLGLEIALDLAWQCSPDHPWVREHPEWFRHRPDGTIKYAENPPKQYQDIYPLDFESREWRALWHELLEVTLFWVDRGIRIFRVDNPHTKTFGFWEWFIEEVHARDPGVLFLAEAFTRPKPMRYLAKAGFTQSYTYFTWRNTKAELTAYLTELTATDVREYLRPNLFANTPDILHEYLQHGGRAAFATRLLLAATLGASYGIYSGFELAENRAWRPGSEEYADSEKFQYRKWDRDGPGHIKELVARVNRIRHEYRALQFDWTLEFHATDNQAILAYSKSPPDSVPGAAGSNDRLLVVVNLDPHHMQHGHVSVPGPGPDDLFTVRDLLDEVSYQWRGEWNYVRFDPEVRQGHILQLKF